MVANSRGRWLHPVPARVEVLFVEATLHALPR